MTVKWEDITSYTRGEQSAWAVPRTWAVMIGVYRVIITRHRDFKSDDWILRCYKADIDADKIESKALVDAQKEAIRTVWQKLEDGVAAFREAMT
jgi:hypothetical protein